MFSWGVLHLRRRKKMQTGGIGRERFSGADPSFSPALQFILGVVCSDPCQSQIMRGKKKSEYSASAMHWVWMLSTPLSLWAIDCWLRPKVSDAWKLFLNSPSSTEEAQTILAAAALFSGKIPALTSVSVSHELVLPCCPWCSSAEVQQFALFGGGGPCCSS